MTPETLPLVDALKAGDTLGETPFWSVTEAALYWVNCENPAMLRRWHPASGATREWPMPKRIGGFVFKADGGILVVLADGVYDFDPDSGALALRAAAPLPPHVMLHECQCDRQGRLWTGSYDHHFTPENRNPRGAAFFRLDGDVLTPVITDINVSNGLGFSPDGRTLYASDSPSRIVYAYDLDPATGEISNGRPFVTLDPAIGFVDGATVDAEGGYWLAAVGSGTLRRYLPDGTLDRVVGLPVYNPTKPAFGGDDMATLYVTSTPMKIRLPLPAGDRNGDVVAVRPGVVGIAETPFSGLIGL